MNKRSQPPKGAYKRGGLFAHTEPAVVRGGHGGGALEPRHAGMRQGSRVSGCERRPKTKPDSVARVRQRVAGCLENKKRSKPSLLGLHLSVKLSTLHAGLRPRFTR